jgi:hypothetical protein
MRKLAAVAVTMSLMVGQAYSLPPAPSGAQKTPMQIEREEQQRRAKDIDADYDAAMKRSRANTPNAASDPWHNLRSPTLPDSKK